ncbi:SCO family protein [Shimia aestuarii]|uniref:Protein SCO1/2 n=1 Tax=Shimia aestuarii TaxID=254406 RepID=A0A1I4KGA2_9RHOB|nr:SCO family protein [Shimia aestuarii]SFL77633.1 protein SCO1/2 [Shimia aestuarii]
MARIAAIIAVFATILVLGGMWFISQDQGGDDQFAQCREGQVAGGASAIGGPFELVSETGETVTDKDVLTEPSLLYFGYTFCPDVCPMDTSRNAEAVEILESNGKMVQPIFISIDPARDTPEVMAEFTDYLHPRMLGLTGSPAQIKAASQAYRTYYKKQDPEDGDEEFYLVDHSTFTYLTLPGHGFVEYFRRDVTPEQMADRVGCFLENM